ncbi:UNVERIFIED_CONTAM: hypothetical protein RMT77_008685 [Armadillidium vulgare]
MAVSEKNSEKTEKLDYEWDVYSLCYKPESKFGIIVLNTGLSQIGDKKHFIELWTRASVRLCVDGGANDFYYSVYKDLNKEEEFKTSENNELQVSDFLPIPDIISGDFDSVEQKILGYFKNVGTKIIPTPDQNETDFTKSLKILRNYSSECGIEVKHTLVIGGTSCSRFDHVLSQIHTLYKIRSVIPYPIIVICGSSLYWLLNEGFHRITIPPSVLLNEEKSWCGFASLNEPVIVSTSGLKWDVENKKVIFGEMISTSNTYCENSKGYVDIKCSKPLLWFMGWDQM